VLALGAKVAGEALAETAGVIADTTPRAVATLLVAVTQQHIRSRRALLKGAVWAAVAKIAHASDVLHGIPRRVVGLVCLYSELLLRVANSSASTVVGAHRAFARYAIVVLKALTLAGLTVANAFIRAFYLRVRFVRCRCNGNPRCALWASSP